MKQTRFIRVCLGLLFGFMLLGISGCGTKNEIYGKWEEPVSGVVMEITEDGQLLMTLHGTTITMKYELQDPDILILKTSEDGSIPDQKMTYKVDEDQLTISLDGVENVFSRVK